MKPIFQLRFTGGGLKPGVVPSRELAELLIAAEEAITSLALQRNPALNPDEIVVGLMSIEDKSLGLAFASTTPDVVVPAFKELADRVAHRSFADLPSRSLRGLRVLAEFTTSRKCRTQFWNGDARPSAPLAEMEEGFEHCLPVEHFIRGDTVIYGKVERVGGVEPRVRVRLSGHEVVSCYVSEGIAIELGSRLYSEVGLRGQATWDARDHSLAYFRVDEVLPYQYAEAVPAALALRAAAHGVYDGVADVVGHVEGSRGAADE